MIWSICFYASVITFILFIIGACIVSKLQIKKWKWLTSFHMILGGVAVSSFLQFIPNCTQSFPDGKYKIAEVFLSSLYNTMQLFLANGDMSLFTENTVHVSPNITELYLLFSTVLVILAPFLTFGFVLSFFKNISAYKDYIGAYFSDLYIFSELNEEAFSLSQSLKLHDKKRKIIFTNIYSSTEGTESTLVENARRLGAILFPKDITSIHFNFHSKNRSINFFIIGNDDSIKTQETLSLLSKYKT